MSERKYIQKEAPRQEKVTICHQQCRLIRKMHYEKIWRQDQVSLVFEQCSTVHQNHNMQQTLDVRTDSPEANLIPESICWISHSELQWVDGVKCTVLKSTNCTSTQYQIQWARHFQPHRLIHCWWADTLCRFSPLWSRHFQPQHCWPDTLHCWADTLLSWYTVELIHWRVSWCTVELIQLIHCTV